jgi:cell division protein FtsZ
VQDDFRPQSKLFQAPPAEPVAQPAQPQMLAPAPQPQPVREMQPAAVAQPRMPRVEDFPPVVKAEVEAKSRPADHESSGPMGLLKRLTNGLSRREEEPARLQPAQPREPKLRQPAPEARRIASQDPQLYAPRRGQLDEHGRLQPQARATQEDDQLEIPAFLRRQAN